MKRKKTRPPAKATGSKPASQAANRPETEPTANLAPAPLWLVFLFGLLFYLGQLYVDHAGGGFSPQVYEPYQDFVDVKTNQPRSEGGDLLAKGAKAYGIYCVACHMPSGGGDPSRSIPPLAESEWVIAEKPGRIIRIVSKGLTGSVQVKGNQFGGAAMQAVGDQMMGEESEKIDQIAAVLTYVRNSFGNKAPPLTVQQVKLVREKIKDRTDAWTEAELKSIGEDE